MRRVPALTAALVLGLAPVPAPAAGPGCAWPAELEPTLVNVLYPDQNARYWVSALPATPDASLLVRGEFPHARYMSFTTYTATAQSIDGIHDARIAPDGGNTNPFLPGADRTAAARSYSVRVVVGNRPASPAPNTLYTGNEDGSKSARFFLLAYRVFRPDTGRDQAGGVPLPRVTLQQAGAPDVDMPSCQTEGLPPNDVNDTIAGTSSPAPPLVGYPGVDPPVWHKFYNFAEAGSRSTDNEITGTSLSDEMAPGAMERFAQGGFADNPDNNYIYVFANPGYGPMLLLRGRLPATPKTAGGEPVMGSGQMRYWSICTNHALSQRFYACLADDQMVTDAQGNYRIVISSAADRPADAVPECGNNWLPAGPRDTVVIVRNMLPDPAFEYSIQRAGYGSERADMGPYYPDPLYIDGFAACSA